MSDIMHKAVEYTAMIDPLCLRVDKKPGAIIEKLEARGWDFSEVTEKDCDARDEDIKKLVPDFSLAAEARRARTQARKSAADRRARAQD